MKVTYRGGQPARVITLPGGSTVRAERGKPVDVPSEVANGLVKQRDWAKPGTQKAASRKPASSPETTDTAPAEPGANNSKKED